MATARANRFPGVESCEHGNPPFELGSGFGDGDGERHQSALPPHVEEQLGVAARVVATSQDAGIAVHLDREAESPQSPPGDGVPGNQHHGEEGDEQQAAVAGAQVLLLVIEDEAPGVGISLGDPGG
jgi:hypothetical protein